MQKLLQQPRKQDGFLRGRQIAYLIYEYLWVTGANDSFENYVDLCTISRRHDDIQEFDSKWDGNLLSLTKIPLDDMRIRESEKLNTVLELYHLDIHQKKLGSHNHGWKQWWREVSSKTYELRILAPEMEIMRSTPWSRIKGQKKTAVYKEFLKGDNCSFRHDINKRGKSSPSNPFPNSFMQQNDRKSSRTRSPRCRSPRGRTSRWPCRDYLRGTCNNSFCERWHRPDCVFYDTKSGCRFLEKCSFAHRQVDEQPTERSKKKNDDKSAVAILKKIDWYENVREPVVNHVKAHVRSGRPGKKRDHELKRGPTARRSSNSRQLGCVFQDMKPPKSKNSRRLLRDTLKLEIKIPRSVTFAKVNLISVAPMLQNLRIVHKKRQSGKS